MRFIHMTLGHEAHNILQGQRKRKLEIGFVSKKIN